MKLGLIGLAGAGKDTAALILRKVLNEQGKRYSIDRYAALLKKCAEMVFGSTFDDRDVKEEMVFVTPELADKIIAATDLCQLYLKLNPVEFELWNALCIKHLDKLTWISPRLFQQLLGTEIGRAVDSEVWVKFLQDKCGDLIVPDVRFANELCDYNILVRRNDVPTGVIHSSEALAVDCMVNLNPEYDSVIDYTLWNTGSIEELETKIRFLVTTLKL